MSDGSFPHKQPQPDVPEPPPKEERVGARVLDFPTEEVTGNSIVPAGTWADDAADGAPLRPRARVDSAPQNILVYIDLIVVQEKS